MRFIISILFLLFNSGCFSQVYVKAIHNSHEISITIYSDTTLPTVFIGCFEPYKFVCRGNVVKVKADEVKTKLKGSKFIELNFCMDKETVLTEENQFTFQEKGMLKIRLIRPKGIRIPRNKNLKIYLTIDKERIEIVSQRYKRRFCHRKMMSDDKFYKVLNGSLG
nr:hypothetical protein [uncultured Fluviicola sp.]